MSTESGSLEVERIAERPAREGIWRRGRVDAAKALNHPLAIWIILAIDAVATAAGAIWVARTKNPTALEIGLGAAGGVVVGLLVVGLCLFGWNSVRAPIKQRDEARSEVQRLQRLVHPEFPPHDLQIERPWSGLLPLEPGQEDVRVMFVPIRYTNRQRDRAVSLQFDLVWEGRDLGAHTVSRAWRAEALPNIIKLPLHVGSDRTEQGDLAFEPHESWVFEFPEAYDSAEVWVKSGYEIRLRVTDHVSGATLEQPVPERDRR